MAVFAMVWPGSMFTGCKEGNPSDSPVNNEHAPPTTITVMFVRLDTSGVPTSDTTWALARDTSVVKGLPSIVGRLELAGSASYMCRVVLTDESASPSRDVTEDIEREKDGHMFIYLLHGGMEADRIRITILDKDSRGLDVGLYFRADVTPGPSSSGFLNISLRHYDSLNKYDTVFDTDVNRDIPVDIH
jgi:hypothetical protein